MTKNKTLTLGEILSYIVSQESSREGGYAEYALNEESKNRGNPLQHQEELKQAILQWVADEIIHCKDYEVIPQTPGDVASFQHNQDAIAGSALQDYQVEILKDHGWKPEGDR